MNRIDFQLTALSILSTRGEMRSLDLWDAINEKACKALPNRPPCPVNPEDPGLINFFKFIRWHSRYESPVSAGKFFTGMNDLQREGAVVGEIREDPSRQNKKYSKSTYYRITTDGGKKRINLAQHQANKVIRSQENPKPAFG